MGNENTFTDILTEKQEHILRIKINRPQKKNALTIAMYAALADAIARAEETVSRQKKSLEAAEKRLEAAFEEKEKGLDAQIGHATAELQQRVNVLKHILGASSDYLVADVSAAAATIRVGDELAFAPNYSALLAVMTSAYVEKCSLREGKRVDQQL